MMVKLCVCVCVSLSLSLLSEFFLIEIDDYLLYSDSLYLHVFFFQHFVYGHLFLRASLLGGDLVSLKTSPSMPTMVLWTGWSHRPLYSDVPGLPRSW